MLVLFFRKYHQSISRQKNMEFYHVTGLYPDFYGNKCEKNLISGNPVRQNLATLLVLGIQKI